MRAVIYIALVLEIELRDCPQDLDVFLSCALLSCTYLLEAYYTLRRLE